MSTIKNPEICSILRQWLKDSGTSIAKAAGMLGISGPVLWRQLAGKETIPLSRVQEMIRLFSPSEEEATKLTALIEGRKTKQERKPGDIVYYGMWGRVCKGVFCGHTLNGRNSVVFQILPQPIILQSKDCGSGEHDFYACELVRNEDLFSTPQELMDHETAEIRERMERQLDTFTADKK